MFMFYLLIQAYVLGSSGRVAGGALPAEVPLGLRPLLLHHGPPTPPEEPAPR